MLKYVFIVWSSCFHIQYSCKNECECYSPQNLEKEGKRFESSYRKEKATPSSLSRSLPILLPSLAVYAHTHTHKHNSWEKQSQPLPSKGRRLLQRHYDAMGAIWRALVTLWGQNCAEIFTHVTCTKPQSGSSLATSLAAPHTLTRRMGFEDQRNET